MLHYEMRNLIIGCITAIIIVFLVLGACLLMNRQVTAEHTIVHKAKAQACQQALPPQVVFCLEHVGD